MLSSYQNEFIKMYKDEQQKNKVVKNKLKDLKKKHKALAAFYETFINCPVCKAQDQNSCVYCSGNGRIPKTDLQNLYYFVNSLSKHDGVKCSECRLIPIVGVRFSC